MKDLQQLWKIVHENWCYAVEMCTNSVKPLSSQIVRLSLILTDSSIRGSAFINVGIIRFGNCTQPTTRISDDLIQTNCQYSWMFEYDVFLRITIQFLVSFHSAAFIWLHLDEDLDESIRHPKSLIFRLIYFAICFTAKFVSSIYFILLKFLLFDRETRLLLRFHTERATFRAF